MHAVLLLLLVSLHFSGAFPVSPTRVRAVILLTPSRDAHVPRPIPVPSHPLAPPATPRIPPRGFSGPVQIRPAPPPILAAPESLHLVTPLVLELPGSSAVFAPPLKTDNLSDLHIPAPNSAPRQIVKATGAFDSATPAAPVVSRDTGAKPAGFGDATIAAAASQTRATAPTSPLTPVEILSKPRPAYTDDARRLLIQGEVLLQMVFLASGEIRVDRVVRGLGHGLDETAVAAARGIRFRPARRAGMPVDFEATVHILFELAN
jgi:TonB family protein